MNNNYNSINLRTILYLLFVRILGNTLLNSIINIILPIILSLLFEIPEIDRNKHFNFYVMAIIISLIIYNILYYIATLIKDNKEKWQNLFESVSFKISAIHKEAGNNIFRMHKHTKASMSTNTYVDKSHFNKIIDFQQVSFLVCKAVYDIVSSQLDCDECEVTVYQKFSKKDGERWDHVKMIAYATKDSTIPATYEIPYYINKKADNTVFMRLFKKKTVDAVILHNKKAVKDNFKILEESRTREEKICQYIGIPVKTNNNNITCILQVDVSKKHVLGKNYKEIKFFADKILLPFSTLLYSAYERDCVFNTLYDIWSKTLLKDE